MTKNIGIKVLSAAASLAVLWGCMQVNGTKGQSDSNNSATITATYGVHALTKTGATGTPMQDPDQIGAQMKAAGVCDKLADFVVEALHCQTPSSEHSCDPEEFLDKALDFLSCTGIAAGASEDDVYARIGEIQANPNEFMGCLCGANGAGSFEDLGVALIAFYSASESNSAGSTFSTSSSSAAGKEFSSSSSTTAGTAFSSSSSSTAGAVFHAQ